MSRKMLDAIFLSVTKVEPMDEYSYGTFYDFWSQVYEFLLRVKLSFQKYIFIQSV